MCQKMGNYATVPHTEFELNSIQNDRVRADYGCGSGEIGGMVNCHLNMPYSPVGVTGKCHARVNAGMVHENVIMLYSACYMIHETA